MRYVMYSGGLGSFGEAWLAIERYGREGVELVFADTQIEDSDLYRFLGETAAFLKVPLHHIKTENLFDLARRKRTLPNNRIPFCSRMLKVEPSQDFVRERLPATAHFGLYWHEIHRLERVRERWCDIAPVESLLCEARWDRPQIEAILERCGIAIPRLYALGFEHNNCGGSCVRAGKRHWQHLLRVFPERYAEFERLEEEISAMHDKRYTILRDVSLAELRREAEAAIGLFDDDSSGCGCFVLDESA